MDRLPLSSTARGRRSRQGAAAVAAQGRLRGGRRGSDDVDLALFAGDPRAIPTGADVTTDDEVREAREELGRTLEELKAGLDEVLATARERLDEKDHRPVEEDTEVTPDVGGALWELLRRMPGVIGNSISGDEERVGRARETLARLDSPAAGRRGWTSMTVSSGTPTGWRRLRRAAAPGRPGSRDGGRSRRGRGRAGRRAGARSARPPRRRRAVTARSAGVPGDGGEGRRQDDLDDRGGRQPGAGGDLLDVGVGQVVVDRGEGQAPDPHAGPRRRASGTR